MRSFKSDIDAKKLGSQLTKAVLLEVSSTGELLRKKELNVGSRQGKTVSEDLLMSNEGKILMLRVQSNEHTAVTLQCFFEAEPALNKPDCVQFSHATKGTIFAFVGNYLCWIVGKFP